MAGPKVYDDFVSALASAVDGLAVRDPASENTEMGPLISASQRERVSGFMERLPGGAERVTGGAAIDGPGHFYAPTVVAGLDQGDEMIQREVFGPVVTFQRFGSEEEAIAWANDVDTASPRASGPATSAARDARALRFGCVWVNDHIPLASEMPHGGFKQSGYGKDMSAYALEDNTELKHVMISLG